MQRRDLIYRSQTIENPCLFEGETFGIVNCEYATFEKQVRFKKCTFEEDVVFGDELCDEAYSVIKSDLIFDECTFKKKVKLDGLQCSGHVIFKGNCVFEYGDETENYDDVLSMSNSFVGIGVCLQDTIFKAGINFSATHIKQVGCQFVNVKFKNSQSGINFRSSYMGRELSIRTSNIVCNVIDFNGVSVDDSQGTLQLGGNSYITSIDNKTIVTNLVSSIVGFEVNDSRRVLSIYKIQDSPDSPLLFVNEKNNTINKTELIAFFQTATKNNNDVNKIIWDDAEGNNIGLTPVGEIFLIFDTEGTGYLSLFYQDTIYCHNPNENCIVVLSSDDIASTIFKNIIDEKEPLKYHFRNHRSVPMIYATTQLDDIYIAIYDLNHSYKIFKWNYIKCNMALDLSQTHVGRGLYLGQSEFDVVRFDIHSLNALHELFFEDIVFNIYSLDASQLTVPTIRFNNIDFIYKELDQRYINNPDDWDYCGINFDFASLQNKMILESLSSSNYNESFRIKTNFVSIKNIFLLRDIRHDITSPVSIELKNSVLNLVRLEKMQWDHLQIETENICFEDFGIDGNMANYQAIMKLWQNRNIVGKIIEEDEEDTLLYPIHFFKQLDNMYDKYDSYNDQRLVWKLRNRMRIKRDHKYSTWLRIPVNEILLNYGWSPWPIVFWLIGFIILFDIITCQCFGMDVPSSVVNGFVEFIPITFNEPIVEQIHGINAPNVAYKPPFFSFEYSALVTGYRLLSYTLLSVLIAACAGYFRKQNE